MTLYAAMVQADGRIRIQQLAKDGLSAIPGAVSPPFPPHPCEAPLLFRRHDTYYALFGHNCPCCPEGSELFVYTAPHPLGPWSGGQDVNRDSSTGQRVVNGQVNDFESLKHKLSFHSNAYVRTNERRAWFTEADDSELQYENSSILLCIDLRQSAFVVPVGGGGGKEPVYLWATDQWGSGSTRAGNWQYWAPLSFTEKRGSRSNSSSIEPLTFQRSWYLDLNATSP